MATAHPYAQAFQERNLEALGEMLADDVVFHSPVIGDQAFEGRHSVLALLEVASRTIQTERYTHDIGEDGFHILIADSLVLGIEVKVTNVLEFDPEGKIREIWVMARPLRGVAAIQEVMGSGLAGRRSATLGRMARVASKPLAGLTGLTDRIGARVAASLNRESADR